MLNNEKSKGALATSAAYRAYPRNRNWRTPRQRLAGRLALALAAYIAAAVREPAAPSPRGGIVAADPQQAAQ